VLDGLGVPAYSPIPQNVQFYDPKSSTYAPQYNLVAARKVLAANHVKGPFTLLTFNTPTDTAAGELIQAELAQVGVTVNIVSKPIPDFISIAQKGTFDMYLDWFYALDADILYLTLDSAELKGGGLNFTFYKSHALDSLIAQGRAALGNAKAAHIYAQAQRFVDRNVIVDPLWLSVGVFATRSRVGGFHTDPTGLLPVFQDLYIKK
jgi:peptide/nickel transport system substrate-binding protein